MPERKPYERQVYVRRDHKDRGGQYFEDISPEEIERRFQIAKERIKRRRLEGNDAA